MTGEEADEREVDYVFPADDALNAASDADLPVSLRDVRLQLVGGEREVSPTMILSV